MEREERKNEIREGGVHERESERGLLPRSYKRQIVKIEIGKDYSLFIGSSQTLLLGIQTDRLSTSYLILIKARRTRMFSLVGPNAGEMSVGVGGIRINRKRQEGERRPKVTETRSDVRSLVTALTLVDVDINISLLSLKSTATSDLRERGNSLHRPLNSPTLVHF